MKCCYVQRLNTGGNQATTACRKATAAHANQVGNTHAVQLPLLVPNIPISVSVVSVQNAAQNSFPDATAYLNLYLGLDGIHDKLCSNQAITQPQEVAEATTHSATRPPVMLHLFMLQATNQHAASRTHHHTRALVSGCAKAAPVALHSLLCSLLSKR